MEERYHLLMEERYRLLIENLPDAFAYCRVITDSEGNPEDHLFLYVNSAFSEMVGITTGNIIGKKASEVFPGIKKAAFDWIGIFSKVARTGKKICFEYFHKPLGRQYEITAYSNENGHFAVVFYILGKRNHEVASFGINQGTFQSLFTVLDAIDAFVYVADMETYDILFVNRWGKDTLSNAIGKKCWQVIQGNETGPCEFCTNDKLLDSFGRPTGVYRWEFMNRKNGRWFDCRDIALQWIDGRMVRLEIATDITEYKKMQEKLKKDRNKLAVLLEGMLDTTAVWINTLDEKGNVTYFNKAAEQISGYRAEEIIGHDRIWKWLYPAPECYAKNSEIIHDVIHKGKRIENYETEIQRKDGQSRTILWHSNRLIEAGETIGSIAFGADITERKQIEKQLRVSEERYSLLVNNANEAIIVVQDGLIKYVNPMAVQLFNCSVGEMLSTDYFGYVYPDDQVLVRNRYKNIIEGKKVQNPYTYRIKTLDGSIKLVSANSVKVNWEGHPADLALMTDVTGLKKMEEEIIKADKFESISMLAGGIAHDFNNYLATLLGNISLVRLYKNDYSKINEKLGSIEKAVHQAKILSNQLFTLAKGRKPDKKKIFIQNLIIDNVNFTLSGSNVRCNFFIENDLKMVEVDEGQFCQVLNNIVINAVQAMPDGGVIDIFAKNVMVEPEKKDFYIPLKEGPYLKIAIKDRGTGIEEKNLIKIFDPFFTTKQKGSGLGLATSYSIIKKHGGHLSVESKMGFGTTFYIFLPACSDTGGTATRQEDIIYGEGTILLMDDDETVLKVTGEMLSSLGYDVIFSRDGEEAIEKYTDAFKKGWRYDLVIMDLTVPGGLGGRDTIRELLKRDPNVKAIVYSGYSNDPVLNNYLNFGFKGAIKKPFSIENLSRLVFETIYGSKPTV